MEDGQLTGVQLTVATDCLEALPWWASCPGPAPSPQHLEQTAAALAVVEGRLWQTSSRETSRARRKGEQGGIRGRRWGAEGGGGGGEEAALQAGI